MSREYHAEMLVRIDAARKYGVEIERVTVTSIQEVFNTRVAKSSWAIHYKIYNSDGSIDDHLASVNSTDGSIIFNY